jgi:hypothetical protein
MSDMASNMLREERVEGEAEYYRQKYISRHHKRKTPSVAGSAVSAMPALPTTALSPEDAADAHDLGRPLAYEDQDTSVDCCGRTSLFPSLGVLLDILEFDFETKRILAIAIPSTVSAIAEPLYRIVVMGTTAYLINTESAVAYAISLLLLRLSLEPISGALADAQYSALQYAMSEGGDNILHRCGQLIQSAMVLQALLCIPICVVWSFFMDEAVRGLISVDAIADAAGRYAKIVVIDYAAQAICRSYMLVFQVVDQGFLEINIDLFGNIIALVAVPAVVSLISNPTIELLAWTQVGIGLAKVLTKMVVVSMRRWMSSYRSGILSAGALFVSCRCAVDCIMML